MKQSGYMIRAMRSGDRRYARVLSRLGYQTADMAPDDSVLEPILPREPVPDDILAGLREEYHALSGKPADRRWGDERLQREIASLKTEES